MSPSGRFRRKSGRYASDLDEKEIPKAPRRSYEILNKPWHKCKVCGEEFLAKKELNEHKFTIHAY